MKLLILTQKVDRHDPILGFFHRWIEEFAKHCEKVTVICLEMGEYELPENVRVLSLGKEAGQSRFKYLWNFYRYIWNERNNYGSVFVHMNQEYVLLAGVYWRLLGKKVLMWRNYHYGNLLTRLAVTFCHNTLCTSIFSYTAKFKKNILMPVGVDVEYFRVQSDAERMGNSILSIGRIAPDKKLEVLIEALAILDKEKIDFRTSIYGSILLEEHRGYEESLHKLARTKNLDGKISFHPAIPNYETPGVYSAHEIFVNISPSGMYDKTIFEAAACGSIPLASSNDWSKIADPRLVFDASATNLAGKLSVLLNLPVEEKEILRKHCLNLAHTHSLEELGKRVSALVH